ncbi:MAG TPA: WD40 repeat domain-containing protein, partial [Pyrinomonadaceae bacterium]
ALPAECRQSRVTEKPESFKQWQQLVLGYTGLGRRESLHGLLAKQQLSPPLRSDISRLRFSPDGNYILAQDDSGISVLSREPFAPLFRIETDDSKPAQFSPDSKSVVFSSENLRVSKWSINDQKVTSTHELIIRKGCLQTSLSADGKFLACLKGDMNLVVLEVESGRTVIERKDFMIPTFYQLWSLFATIAQDRLDNADAGLRWINMGFSPDVRYFVAGYMGRDNINRLTKFETVEAFDLTTSKQISVADSVKRSIVGGFTFMAPDKIAGINYEDFKKSGVFSFPDGKLISEFTARGNLEAATLGNFLFVRPIKDFPVGVLDLKTNAISKSNKQPALDIYGELLVAEMRNGELGLYRVEKNQLVASTLLTNINLGSLKVAEVSPDMKWISLSGRSRGGV